MRYHVGRACAVAGFVGLYKELNLLPDVAIAEEARDNSETQGSQEIFNLIAQHPVRWRVMDDYTRTVNLSNPVPALHGLNGDTAVRSTLELKRAFEEPGEMSRFQEDETYQILDEGEHAPPYFNITEDWNIDEYDSALGDARPRRLATEPCPNTAEMVMLLWKPLPRDLPAGNKDILILLAAYHGNIDRYDRLRRPGFTLKAEANCVIRGIYHNPLFARWWAEQPLTDETERYQPAINARFIMSNDLSRITPETPRYHLPRLIWYPSLAHASTYEELARRRPDMHTAVARACIAANNPRLWDKLDIDVGNEGLWEAANASNNPHFLDDLRRRVVERAARVPTFVDRPNRMLARQGLSEPSATLLRPGLPSVDHVRWDQQGPYDGIRADASALELWACVPEQLRPSEEYHFVDLAQLYREMGQVPPVPQEQSSAYARRST